MLMHWKKSPWGGIMLANCVCKLICFIEDYDIFPTARMKDFSDVFVSKNKEKKGPYDICHRIEQYQKQLEIKNL